MPAPRPVPERKSLKLIPEDAHEATPRKLSRASAQGPRLGERPVDRTTDSDLAPQELRVLVAVSDTGGFLARPTHSV